MELFNEIIAWASELPMWQQVAVLKVIERSRIDDDLVDELVQLCIDEQKDPKELHEKLEDPLAGYKYELPDEQEVNVAIEYITDTKNVNAIKDGSTLPFGTAGLTVVYGDNAVGKSGYTRVLKSACTCRDDEPVLGNVSREEVATPSATIKYLNAGSSTDFSWSETSQPDILLKTVHIFDTRAARVYLNEEQDIKYVPAGLDIFDKLVEAIAQVKDGLNEQVNQLNAASIDFETPFSEYANTEAYRVITDLTQQNARGQVAKLQAFTDEENKEIVALEADIKKREANSPIKRKELLAQKWQRFTQLLNYAISYKRELKNENIQKLVTARKAMFDAAELAEKSKKSTFDEVDFLPGTGGQLWKALWSAAREYSENAAYHEHSFPNTDQSSKCVLCQQVLDKPTGKRFVSFDKFMADKSQELAKRAKQTFDELLAEFVNQEKLNDDVLNNIYAELETDEYDDLETLKASIAALKTVHTEILAKLKSEEKEIKIAELELDLVPLTKFKVYIQQIVQEAKTFDIGKFTTELSDKRKRLAELKARKLMVQYGDKLTKELDNIASKKIIKSAADGANTMIISKKAGSLTEKYLVDSLKDTFNAELQGINRIGLTVELNKTKVRQGVSYSEIVLSSATAPSGGSLKADEVMSESEQKLISLAGFFAELSLAPHKSSIILDDPVTSLDHYNVERIAERIVKEASNRQVIVFTHNVVFVASLMKQAEQVSIVPTTKTISKRIHTGGVNDGLPWVAQNVKSRVGWLNNKHQELNALYSHEEFEKYNEQVKLFYTKLRETWERAVEEQLFAGVVKRFSRNVETQKLRYVTVTEDDTSTVATNMTRCSNFAHDNPEEANDIETPDPAALKVDIATLTTWCSELKTRQGL